MVQKNTFLGDVLSAYSLSSPYGRMHSQKSCNCGLTFLPDLLLNLYYLDFILRIMLKNTVTTHDEHMQHHATI